jgi:hypothetical protein
MFQYVKELLPFFKKEVERFIERLEVGQSYGVGFFMQWVSPREAIRRWFWRIKKWAYKIWA